MTENATTPAKTWPITIGAEGIAAAQFARCGFDVQVQAGRDKPWYDLVVTRAGNLLKISVKATETGRWCLTQGYTRHAAEVKSSNFDCQAAIDRWMDSYGSRTICCLVQFEHVGLTEMPRIYLAFPRDVAARMREAAIRTGVCALFEKYTWTAQDGTKRVEVLPNAWLFSQARIDELLEMSAPGFAIAPRTPSLSRAAAMPA